MSRIISNRKLVVVRKGHRCSASDWLDYIDDLSFLTFGEKRSLIKARRANYKIQPGEMALTYVWKECEGIPVRLWCIPEIDAICLKYDIYESEDAC